MFLIAKNAYSCNLSFLEKRMQFNRKSKVRGMFIWLLKDSYSSLSIYCIYIYKDNFKQDFNWEKKLIANTHFTLKISGKENESIFLDFRGSTQDVDNWLILVSFRRFNY